MIVLGIDTFYKLENQILLHRRIIRGGVMTPPYGARKRNDYGIYHQLA
jgi:hypothetical protein